MLRNNTTICFIEILLLGLLIVLVSMFYLNQEWITWFFNSDELMVPSIFKDLLLDNGHYKDWSLSPAPHFFPDALIFLPGFLLTKDIYIQFLICLCLQLMLLYLSVKYIYCQFFQKTNAVLFSLASFSAFYLLNFKYITPYFQCILLPGAHTGQVIVGIFLVGIQLKIISSEAKFIHKKYLFIGVIISFLAGLSDLLFFIQFSSAVLFSYLIFYFKGYLKFKDISYYAFLPFVASLAGILLTKHVVPVDVFSSYLSIFSIKTVTFSRMYAQYIQITHVFKNELNLFSSILFIIFYTGTFLIAFSYLFFFRKTSTLDKTLIFLSYFILFSFCFSVLSICLVGPTVFVLSRYMLPAFYLPFLTIFYLFAIFRNFKFINTSLVWLCIFLVPLYILLSMRVLLNKPGFSIKLSYYPADILCIDQALHDYGHTGISQYWDANLISMLSKENLQVVPVFSDLKKFHFSMNSKKFKNSYSFAVVDIGYISGWKLDEMLIENINGKPERTVICGGRKLLIYPKNNLKLS